MTRYFRESAVAFAASLGFLVLARQMSHTSILIADRFLPGAGWAQIGLLAFYAAFVANRLMDLERNPAWRRRIWLLFSVVFFAQLVLGLAGLGIFLMSGKLHLPIPALILAGPLYRGAPSIMPILFGASLIVLGPAWCSYLCYFGAWDGLASRAKPRPGTYTKWKHLIRAVILALSLGMALLLRFLGAPPLLATWIAAGFGLGGIAFIALVSTRTGVMAHCVTWCPVGLVANLLGKINPFRIRIGPGCTSCMACTLACRYDALGKAEVAARKPGLSCTLCGDCVTRCAHDSIGYRFPGLGPAASRRLFVVLASIMHTLFIGIAMT